MHVSVRATLPWAPANDEERAAVLRQMDRLLNSRHFRNSKRYPAMLEYLIRETLAGNSHFLKERVLGIAVFHRPADYDANADPIVRVTAGEIRKRIAQFYQEEEGEQEIHIDLRPGSYVPEFYPIPPATNGFHKPFALEMAAEVAKPAPDPASDANSDAGNKRTRRYYTLAIITSALMVLGIVAYVIFWNMQQDQRLQMWSPLVNSPAPVLVVVGQPHAAELQTHPQDSVYDLSATSELYLPDAIAMAHLCAMLDAHHQLYQIAAVSTTSLSDLRKGPTILVGGFNNPWTLRILSPLRFYLSSVDGSDSTGSPQLLQIVDRKNPAGSTWTMNLQQPISAITHDYAIVARFQSSMTDGLVVVVAGLGSGGTESASKFVNSAGFVRQLAAHAPRDWSNMNMEAVLETEVIGGRAGHTQVIATEFW